MRHLGLLFALAGALTISPSVRSHAEMLTSKTFAFFYIYGTTARDLDEGLMRGGPKVNTTGRRHPGRTEMRFGGRVYYTSGENSCSVLKATVTLTTAITLPRWFDRDKADPDLALIWDAISGDIKRHEERHAEIAREYANLLESEWKRLPPEKDCETMGEKVRLKKDQVIKAHDRKQLEFDRSEMAGFDRRMRDLLEYHRSQRRRVN